MQASLPIWIKIVAFLFLGMWVFTLFLPAYTYSIEWYDGVATPGSVQTSLGLECLMLGWIAPLFVVPDPTQILPPSFGAALIKPIGIGSWSFAGIAWWANFFWGWSTVRMIANKLPNLSAAICAAVLAPFALQSFWIDSGEYHGMASADTPLIGSYIWALTMVGPLLVFLLASVVGYRNPDIDKQKAF